MNRLSPLTTPPVEKSQYMNLTLQEILIVGSASEQVKFSELTMDMFRMIQTLEREPQEDFNHIYDASPAPGRVPYGVPGTKGWVDASKRSKSKSFVLSDTSRMEKGQEEKIHTNIFFTNQRWVKFLFFWPVASRNFLPTVLYFCTFQPTVASPLRNIQKTVKSFLAISFDFSIRSPLFFQWDTILEVYWRARNETASTKNKKKHTAYTQETCIPSRDDHFS